MKKESIALLVFEQVGRVEQRVFDDMSRTFDRKWEKPTCDQFSSSDSSPVNDSDPLIRRILLLLVHDKLQLIGIRDVRNLSGL